jgi:hypothetical protein
LLAKHPSPNAKRRDRPLKAAVGHRNSKHQFK